VEIGEQAAEEAEAQIREAVKDANLVFLVSCLGGGTGTGAAPVIAGIAKELGVLSIGIVTTPFRFEGRRKLRLAEEAIEKMRGHVDALIVINNDNMMRISSDKKLSVNDAFRAADDVLRQGIRLITDLVLRSGVVNIDFADLATVLRSNEKSDAIIGIGESKTSATDAVREALASPLLDRTIEGAHDIILNVVGDESLALSAVQEASEFLRKEAGTDVDMIFGSACDPEMAGTIRAMVVAANFTDEGNGQ
jgi:cell division protein FtsZ